MKKLIILPVMLLVFATAGAQTERRIYTSSEKKSMETRSEERKLTKEEKKKLAAIQDSLNYAMAIHALETLDFVVEADQLVSKTGEITFVSSATNFIALNDNRAVVQIAPYNSGGPNGVGGITLDGMASNIRVKTDKKGNTTFSMSVMGTGLSATIDIRLNEGSNRASVMINPNFSSNMVTLNGVLLPASDSGVFKGSPL